MDMTNISIGTAAVVVILGMAVVFLGLTLLMLVVQLTSRIIQTKKQKKAATAVASDAPVETVMAEPAPGSAGELKLYDTDPRDAAMVMAIVADKMGKPLNELRFKSIREVK